MQRWTFTLNVFLLEGLNALATGFYFNYLFFYLKANCQFSNLQNLLVCAASGLLYVFAALYGGRFGQKHGYVRAMALGYGIMSVSLFIAAGWTSVGGLLTTMLLWTFGMCFTWPNLEALTCDKQPARLLPHLIGIYNVVWAGGSAIAYFLGGALAETLGWNSIFWLPAMLHLVQLGLAFYLIAPWQRLSAMPVETDYHPLQEQHPHGKIFLRLAWVANPFAYIAINAAIPLIPDLASRLQLSPKLAGFFCSIWFFARMVTFAFLAVWPGWHYRFSHLIAAYIGMIACFAGMLLFETLWPIIIVQVLFGWCLGLIYYSSLYYSMHVGETKGEHGGIHEAAIGAGIFGGPAIGAASAWFFPGGANSSVYGVVVALAIGLAVLLVIRRGAGKAAEIPSAPLIASKTG